MDNHVCPFLGTLDETYKRGPHVDYPSFENRCLAVDEYGEDEACVVMLSDQATFCLSSGHALCPRYQAAQEAATTKRLDQLDRRMTRLERDVGISVEMLAVFVRFWVATTPALPEPAAQAARAKAGERYDQFVVALGRRLAKGPKLRQEISEDSNDSKNEEGRARSE